MPEELEVQFVEPETTDPEHDGLDPLEYSDWVEGEVEGIPTVSIYGSELDGEMEPRVIDELPESN